MPKLIVNPTSSARREIKLARTLLSIGRDPSNDLVLPDAMVSRRHAVIECRGNQYYLRDCNSSNGSVVNGDKISERSLRDGDLVAIGTARLLYREELELEDPGAKVVQHPSSPRLHCPSCKADYRKGDLFCRECGAPVQPPAGPRKAVCASCGTAVVLPAKFCNACGARLPLDDVAGSAMTSDPPPIDSPSTPPTPPMAELPDPRLALEMGSAEAPSSPEAAADAAAEPLGGERGQRHPPARSESQRAAPLPIEDLEGPVAEALPLATADPKRPLLPRVGAPPLSPRPGSKPWRPSVVARPEAGAPVPRRPAGPGPRILAAIVDGVLVGLIEAVVVGPLAWFAMSRQRTDEGGASVSLPILMSLGLLAVSFVLGAAYHVTFWALRGATPGKGWAGLEVTGEDGSRLGWGRSLARGVGYALSAASLGFGFLMIFFGGLGLHDRIAGTRVVQQRTGE
jgi:pSer/pThr/pTyr-binding forkhead associated (FHA) protein/uncharacterized RDD family membrane protein YckC